MRILLAALLLTVVGCGHMRIGDYPADDDAQGWKDWMAQECPKSIYADLLDEGFESRMDFNLEMVSASEIKEICGLNADACYKGGTDTMYLPNDGGAFVNACHELGHARGSYTHPRPLPPMEKHKEEDPRERYLWEECDGTDPNNPCPPEFPGGGG